jgi:uncharacterized protein YbgA (DUF1722 family)/uncharacterized protein YbbK (DUF523 family)
VETGTGTTERIRIGISSCLLGQEVRFDGGHKRDAYINGTLNHWFEFVPYCPEVAIGLGTPREPIRIARLGGALRVIGVRTPGLDVTERLRDYGDRVADQIGGLRGYLFKKGSPSCGMERVKVYDEQGSSTGGEKGVGLFARRIMERYPLLPVEEEGRLGDPVLRENFIVRVFVYDRWQRLLADGLTPGRLVAFHSDHKYLILAHNQAAYRRMGPLVARAGEMEPATLAEQYGVELMTALARRATRKQHANVLQHLAGYLKDGLDAEDRRELAEMIDQYRLGRLPLIVPIVLLRHHFRRHPHPYIERQYYLHPHPDELMLRNLI